MTPHLVLRQIIQKKQSTNAHISLRWIAAKMGISSGRLSEILNAKRPLTEYYADKICIALKLSEEDIQQIRQAMASLARPAGPTLPGEVLAQITDSKPFALLCFFQTDIYAQIADIYPDPAAQIARISNRMQIPANELTNLLQFMKDLQVIQWTQNRWAIADKSVINAYDNPNSANLQGHFRDLTLAREISQKLSIFERDLSSLTLTMDPDHMSKAKKLIRDFKRDFARSMEKGDSKEVYQICIQLFPLLIPESESQD